MSLLENSINEEKKKKQQLEELTTKIENGEELTPREKLDFSILKRRFSGGHFGEAMRNFKSFDKRPGKN